MRDMYEVVAGKVFVLQTYTQNFLYSNNTFLTTHFKPLVIIDQKNM